MLNVFKKSTNLKDISYAYANVKNTKGNFAVRQDNITNATNCFYGRNNSSQLNIVVNFGTASHNAFLVGMTNAGNGQIYSYNNTANMVMFNPLTTNMASAFKDDKTIIKAACGPNVKDMSSTYDSCYNLTGAPVCGSKVTNMAYAYARCTNLTGSPVCGKKVTNMFYAYYNCLNMTGSPVCGPNVTDMYNTFYYCNNLTGSPVCGNNVTNMYGTYAYCSNLTGSPVCGNNVTDMNCTYMLCRSLTGNPICGNNVTDMFRTYDSCYNLTGYAIMGSNVINAFAAYRHTNIKSAYIYSDRLYNAMNCFGRIQQKVNIYVPKTGYNATHNTLNTCLSKSGNVITGYYTTWTNDMSINGCYYNEYYNIYIYPVDNVAQAYKENEYGIVTYTTTNTSMIPRFIMTDSEGNPISNYTTEINRNQVMLLKNDPSDVVTSVSFSDSKEITNVTYMTDTITNMSYTYHNYQNLKGSPVCGNNVTTMFSTYQNCFNLTGSPVCGPNVTTMARTYQNCYNITGSPVCGDNVTSMDCTYYQCQSLTGQPVCGDEVTTLWGAYYNCRSLTGSPACGNKVDDMNWAYRNCINLTGSPVCGPNVTTMYGTYYDCYNLYGDFYVYSSNVSNAANCFYGRDNSRRLNIFVNKNTTSYNTLARTGSTSIVGSSITWTPNASWSYMYNASYNIYIYPVDNVAQASKTTIRKSLTAAETVDDWNLETDIDWDTEYLEIETDNNRWYGETLTANMNIYSIMFSLGEGDSSRSPNTIVFNNELNDLFITDSDMNFYVLNMPNFDMSKASHYIFKIDRTGITAKAFMDTGESTGFLAINTNSFSIYLSEIFALNHIKISGVGNYNSDIEIRAIKY